MLELFKKIQNYIVERFSDLDQKKKIMLIGGSLLLVVIVTALILMVTSEEYVVLASNLSLDEAAAIDQELENLNIPRRDNNTTEILVPKDRLSEAKMSLSIAGVYNKSFNH
jgi:flagellar biosynthesis/type III secretory pathway M-ring protein FliF/YscJ